METVGRDIAASDGTRIRLWVRTPDPPGQPEEEPASGEITGEREAVLFVHGATYPGRAIFDISAGKSWLADTEARGRAGYAVDLRGYGDSEAPSAMADRGGTADPPCRAETAANDVAAVLNAIPESTVHLVGYSWGSLVCGLLLARQSVQAASFTAFAPVYRPAPALVDGFDLGDPPKPVRKVTRQEAVDRWTEQYPPSVDPYAYRDPVAFPKFWNVLYDSGQAVTANVPTIQAPNGVLMDLQEAVDADPYAATQVTVPSFVVRGTFDPTATRMDALTLYDSLAAARGYREIAGGTHFLSLEKRAPELFGAVADFHDSLRR